MNKGAALIIFLVGVVIGTTQAYVVTYNQDIDDSSSQHLIGRDKCTYGPSYWCHNITQASACSAVSHCIPIWYKLTLPSDNDDVCAVCKEMVKEARDQLLSNQTQDELRQVLEGSCALIPLKIVANECSSLMDNFIPELVDALASRMDPQQVCAVSGLCNSARIDALLDNRLNCSTCIYYMKKAIGYLNKGDDALRNALFVECGHLGSYSDSCRAAVTEEFEAIRKALSKADANEFCQLVGICKEGMGEDVVVFKPKEDLGCDFCKQLVDYMRQWLSANTTREEFDTITNNLCKETGKYSKKCLDFFHTYGEDIFRLIIDELDAESFCERVGVCPGQLGEAPIWTILSVDPQPMVSLLPGEKLIGTDESNSINVDQDHVDVHIDASPKCELCQYVILQLQSYLDSPQTEHDIEKFVEDLCDKYLPKQMSSQCEEFVTNYGEQLIELIGEEVDPKEICPRLSLCPAPPQPTPTKSILPTCALCEFTVSKLIDLIGHNHTKESIDNAMDKVCHMLPHGYLGRCETFMNQYGDRVVEMILVEGSSHGICIGLGLCFMIDTKVAPLPDTLYTPQVMINGGVESVGNDDPKCVLCEYVISTLALKIKDNATEQEIKAEVELICTHMPKTVKEKCKNFVDLYGDLIIQYLAQEMDPEQVCTELRLCSPQVPFELSLSSCELCHVIEDYFEMKLDDPKFKRNAIELSVKRLCGNLRNLKGACTEMIEDYGSYMLELLDKGAENVCVTIDVC